MLRKDDRYSKIFLKHIPVMITDKGKILCIPSSEEGYHIGITAACYDKETEILTDRGWKYFKDLDKTELVAQINPNTFKIEFVKPLRYICHNHYNKKMIHFKSKFLDIMVTSNHNMFTKHMVNACINFNKFQLLPAKRLFKSGCWVIKQGCTGNKTPINNIKFPPELLGIYIAEGSLYGVNGIEISQNEGEKLEEIKIMLKDNGINYRIVHSMKKNPKHARVIIRYPEFANYVKQFGKASDKFIPDNIKNNSNEVIRKFLDWFLLGDGSKFENNKYYHTCSKRLADDIQECLLRIGYAASIYKYISNFDKKSVMYRVTERINGHSVICDKSHRKKVDYNGKVYCVEVPTHLLVVRKNNKIAICGNSSKGKGICGNYLLGMFYWYLKMPCLIVNDFQQETFENSLPCFNPVFINNLKLLNLNPMPLPIVYVYPSCRNLQENGIKDVEQLFPHIKMCLPTEVVIRNIENFYKLDKSAKYVTGYIEKFLKCKNLEDIDSTVDEILEENFPQEDGKRGGKKFEEMKFKIRTIFKNIFDEQISDTMAPPDAYSYLNIKRNGLSDFYNTDGFYNNLTIQSLMALNLIPSIQTGDIQNERWFSAYMTFIIKSIYEDKFKNNYFQNRLLIMYCPEIDKLWDKASGMDKGGLIKGIMSKVGTNGRRAGIILVWDTQLYNQVPEKIRTNTPFLFVLRKGNDDEVKEIKKDYGCNKDVVEWMLHLNTEPEKGLFECVAFTTRRFILYNPRDGTFSETSEPQRGRLITPLSQHKRPGYPIENVIGLKESKEIIYSKPKTLNQQIRELIQ